MNKTSNRDLSTFKADILRLSGEGIKVRIFNKVIKDWEVRWLPTSQITISGKGEIKIPIGFAIKIGIR